MRVLKLSGCFCSDVYFILYQIKVEYPSSIEILAQKFWKWEKNWWVLQYLFFIKKKVRSVWNSYHVEIKHGENQLRNSFYAWYSWNKRERQQEDRVAVIFGNCIATRYVEMRHQITYDDRSSRSHISL